MDIEISLSCFGENIEKFTHKMNTELLIEKNNQHLSITYRNTKNMDFEKIMDNFLKTLSDIDLPTCCEKLFRIAFFVYPSDGVAFFSTEIGSHAISAIKNTGAGLEITFYPCCE